MEIKRYESQNLTQILELFYNTVHTTNVKDYTAEQQEAWAPFGITSDEIARKRWDSLLKKHFSLVAWEKDIIIGFADLDEKQGYLDHLYIKHTFMRQGVATVLVDRLERIAKCNGCRKIISDVSITARPFFQKCGYHVLQRQEVERNGIILINFKMEKKL